MVLVGFLIPVLKKNKQKQYTRLSQQEEDEHETIPMVRCDIGIHIVISHDIIGLCEYPR